MDQAEAGRWGVDSGKKIPNYLRIPWKIQRQQVAKLEPNAEAEVNIYFIYLGRV